MGVAMHGTTGDEGTRRRAFSCRLSDWHYRLLEQMRQAKRRTKTSVIEESLENEAQRGDWPEKLAALRAQYGDAYGEDADG